MKRIVETMDSKITNSNKVVIDLQSNESISKICCFDDSKESNDVANAVCERSNSTHINLNMTSTNRARKRSLGASIVVSTNKESIKLTDEEWNLKCRSTIENTFKDL